MRPTGYYWIQARDEPDLFAVAHWEGDLWRFVGPADQATTADLERTHLIIHRILEPRFR